MRRLILITFLICLALFAVGCKSGAAIYGKYPGSTDKVYVEAYQQREAFYPVNLCCAIEGKLFCATPREIEDCVNKGGRMVKPGTIPACCEMGGTIRGQIVESFSYYDCNSRGGRVVPCIR